MAVIVAKATTFPWDGGAVTIQANQRIDDPEMIEHIVSLGVEVLPVDESPE